MTGTLDPFWFRTGGSSISQPSLAVALIGCVLFLVAFGQRRVHRVAVVVGATCLLVSQSGHQVIVLVAAVLCVAVLVDFSPRLVLRSLLALSCLYVAATVLTPDTISRAPIWFDRVVVSDESPKRHVWADAGEIVRNVAVPGAGLGAGQFSSRAGLISSGEYLSVSLPAAATGRSEVYTERVDPLLDTFERVGQGSAISKPYSSATSLLAELGPVVWLALIASVSVTVVSHVSRARRGAGLERRIRTALAIGLMFLAGISLVENYLEIPQAVFLPGLLYLVGRSAVDTLAAQGAES